MEGEPDNTKRTFSLFLASVSLLRFFVCSFYVFSSLTMTSSDDVTIVWRKLEVNQTNFPHFLGSQFLPSSVLRRFIVNDDVIRWRSRHNRMTQTLPDDTRRTLCPLFSRIGFFFRFVFYVVSTLTMTSSDDDDDVTVAWRKLSLRQTTIHDAPNASPRMRRRNVSATSLTPLQ